MTLDKPLSLTQKILCAMILAITFVSISQIGNVKNLLSPLEDRVIDYQFLIRGQIASDNDLIRIILIDKDSTMDVYGYQSPTPRPLLTNLVNHLISKGAAVIGIDILLDRPSLWADEDKKLAAAFKDADEKIVLATIGNSDESELIEEELSDEALQPLPIFTEHALVGYSQVIEGTGGIVRQLKLDKSGIPSFVGQIYTRHLGTEPPLLSLNQKGLLHKSWIDINYLGPPSRLESKYASVFPVFTPEEVEFLPEAFFKDKIILIGSGIDGLGDIFLSPFSTAANGYVPTYGVELHALVLDMLLKKNYIWLPSNFELETILFCLFFMVAVIILTIRISIGIPFVIVFSASWIAIVVWAFIHHQMKFPVAMPLCGFVGVASVAFLVINQTQLRQARFLKNTFKRYIPSDLVDQLVTNPEQVDLGGKAKELSIFFSDIEGFTTISEQFTPHELVSFLNIYLGRMTDILFEEKGTLDKYEGDAIIAFFGAPVDVSNHADCACQAALKMQRSLAALNEEWKGQNKPFLNVRMGINTGTVIVGNIGSSTRSDYTVIGDTANLASRLEGVNKIFGTNIIVSQQTLDATKAPYFKRELARLIVKGKTEPIAVYELISCMPSEKEELQILNEKYAVALQAFYNGDFANAVKCFTAIASEHQDKASEFMLSQAIKHLENEPALKHFEGAIILTSK